MVFYWEHVVSFINGVFIIKGTFCNYQKIEGKQLNFSIYELCIL